MKVHEALAEVMEDVRSVGKTDRNSHQNYNFRGIDSVVNAVGPALRRHHVVVVPSVLEIDSESVTVGRNNTQMRSVTVRVEYRFFGPEGDSIAAVSVGEAMDSGDKAVPKAMSVALRTCLLQALMLPTDEPDPDEFSYERGGVRFDPADSETWPEELSVAQAKQVVVAATKGDKKLAASVWTDSNFGDGPFPKDDFVGVAKVVEEFMTSGEGRPF